jgi:hypothetical protein
VAACRRGGVDALAAGGRPRLGRPDPIVPEGGRRILTGGQLLANVLPVALERNRKLAAILRAPRGVEPAPRVSRSIPRERNG